MIHIVWEFRVRPDKVKEFEKHYSSHGTWAELFRKSPEYYGTVLSRDQLDATRYLLTDLWESQLGFENFKEAHFDEYEALDKQCEALTVSETRIGVFQKHE